MLAAAPDTRATRVSLLEISIEELQMLSVACLRSARASTAALRQANCWCTSWPLGVNVNALPSRTVKAGLSRVRIADGRSGRPRTTLKAAAIACTAQLSVREAAKALGVNASLIQRHRIELPPNAASLSPLNSVIRNRSVIPTAKGR